MSTNRGEPSKRSRYETGESSKGKAPMYPEADQPSKPKMPDYMKQTIKHLEAENDEAGKTCSACSAECKDIEKLIGRKRVRITQIRQKYLELTQKLEEEIWNDRVVWKGKLANIQRIEKEIQERERWIDNVVRQYAREE